MVNKRRSRTVSKQSEASSLRNKVMKAKQKLDVHQNQQLKLRLCLLRAMQLSQIFLICNLKLHLVTTNFPISKGRNYWKVQLMHHWRNFLCLMFCDMNRRFFDLALLMWIYKNLRSQTRKVWFHQSFNFLGLI